MEEGSKRTANAKSKEKPKTIASTQSRKTALELREKFSKNFNNLLIIF